MRTLHGIHVHGFPNAFLVQPTQGANLISNVPHNLTDAGRTIAVVIRHALDHGYREVEVTRQAEDDWLALLSTGQSFADRWATAPRATTTTRANPRPPGQLFMGYPRGPSAYFGYIDEWRRRATSRARVPLMSRRPGPVRRILPSCRWTATGCSSGR
jgi:cyclohexanone monooxygenase